VRKIVLLGSPVAHSLSPAIQNAAFETAGLDIRYEAMEVSPEDLAAAIATLRTSEWLGANVTIPHKEAVLPLLDEIHPSAVQTSAVNTIVNSDGHLEGHNTDLEGFVRDLEANWKIPVDARSLILGAGGGARAVAFGLAKKDLDLLLIARNEPRAEKIAEDIRRKYAVEITTLPWNDESFAAATGQCRLIVNATPLGMAPNDETSPWPSDVHFPPDAFIYDLVYSPRETQLVQQARQAGLQALSGDGMLLNQAAIAYELWVGRPAPRAEMREALDEVLERPRIRERLNVQTEVRDA